MSLLLIKIGKAWHTLWREGLFRGGWRIITAGLAMFRRVEPGDILFISGGVGDSVRYRCEHVAEELRLQGLRTSITIQDNPFLASYAEKFNIFVFHRVLYTGHAEELIKRAKTLNKEIIFETDDLVYDPQYIIRTEYFEKMNTFERKLYEHGVGGEILADPYVKMATTTTRFLAEKLRAEGKQVFIVPNKLSQSDVALAEMALRERPTHDTQCVRIGYMSGTASHNTDFTTITEALLRLFATYKEMCLVIAGPLLLDPAFEPYADRIERVPFMPRKRLFTHIASLDINLAPLELDNPFCESKSELKFFEAGIVAVPTVAVANQTFCEAIDDGVNGYTASDTNQWIEKLGHLIQDVHFRTAMGESARKTVLARSVTTMGWNSEYVTYLKKRAK